MSGSKSLFKKFTTSECLWCDYYCRKGHKCNAYKKYVKNNGNQKRKKQDKYFGKEGEE